LAILERAKLNHHNTPLVTELCSGSVAVNDSTHPLHGRSFEIAGIARLPGCRRYYQVEIFPDEYTYVPIDSTDQSKAVRLPASLLTLESIQRLDDTSEAPESATALVGDMKILIPMSGLIDKDAELARLKREIDKLKKAVNSSEQKLANPGYVEKAPSHVVAREQQKVADMQASLAQLQTQRDKILAM